MTTALTFEELKTIGSTRTNQATILRSHEKSPAQHSTLPTFCQCMAVTDGLVLMIHYVVLRANLSSFAVMDMCACNMHPPLRPPERLLAGAAGKSQQPRRHFAMSRIGHCNSHSSIQHSTCASESLPAKCRAQAQLAWAPRRHCSRRWSRCSLRRDLPISFYSLRQLWQHWASTGSESGYQRSARSTPQRGSLFRTATAHEALPVRPAQRA